MDLSAPAAFERAISELLRSYHLMRPHDLADLVAEHVRPLGVLDLGIYLADLQQGWLRPIPGTRAAGRGPLAIDATLEGQTFREIRLQLTETDDGRPRLLIPLLDGSERLGVLDLVVDSADERAMPRYRALASLVGLMIVSRSTYSDNFAAVQRIRPMALQAEMAWAFLPPRSFGTEDVILNVAIEPAYQVGGDAFDYTLNGDRLHVAVFDASGHDLTAGMVAVTALASCRSARRAGAPLEDIAATADEVIGRQFEPGRFATALLCDLDVASGRFTWIPCGHPPPLLVRGSTVIELAAPPRPPLGVPPLEPSDPDHYIRHHQLEPRDRLLLYTDGITEARDAEGQEFGYQRLVDFVIEHGGDGMPAAEALRRLIRAIVQHQHGRLSDDATILQVQWKPGRTAEFLS